MKRIHIFLALAPVLVGCSADFPSVDSPKIPFFVATGAGAYYLYHDNWALEEIQSGGNKYHIALKKNILRQDGNSEAYLLFRRRAKEIVAENGFDGYRIVEYSEGIESAALGAQRVAQGTIQCYKETSAVK
ncbi:MAG: hypothetical protein ACM3JK_04175 [Betaproteobacteria bacterium]